MDTNFPVMQVFKGAVYGPIAYLPGLAKTVVIMAIAFLIVYFYATGQGLSIEVVQGMMNPETAQEMAQQYAIPFLKATLLALVLVGAASAFCFNFWVRFGASGAEGVTFASVGQATSATVINMIKFFFIILLIGIISVVVSAVLGLFGIGPDEAAQMEAMAAGDLQSITLSGIALNVINLVIMCAIYSWFSANLTQTALKSDKEGLEHPHTMDFAVVIFLVYLLVFVPSVLVGLTGSWTLSFIVQLVVGTYVGFAIAVAHGIRYSICMQDGGDTPDDLGDGSDGSDGSGDDANIPEGDDGPQNS